jgi:hypothetical protein
MSLHSEIHLGYEIGTGRAVEIPLRHTAVTGQTQESGKTTTLEGLISRSRLRAVAYVTKRGESSFHVMHSIAPYFQERADWKFVQSLLEASTETKLKFEQSWIMRASEGARTLQDVRNNIRKFINGVRAPEIRKLKHSKKGGGGEFTEMGSTKERWITKPARGLSGDIYYVLDKYLDDVMPQIQELPYSTKLELATGVNVMDLRDYEFPLQALVVRSVIDWTREHEENTINVIPEAWKFAPKQKGSPVRQSAEELIREGGALKNFLWIDSQDLAGVADVLMRQVGVWLFGVQRAKHEIERALDHMPEGLPARRPRPADIATLGKGQFYVCFGREMYKVYVQPAWMTAAHAEAIARGEEDVDSAKEILQEFDHSRIAEVKQKGLNQSGSAAAVKNPAPLARAKGASEEVTGSAAAEVDSEEAMWKEKYEALLRMASLQVGIVPATDEAELYEAIKNLREAHDKLAIAVEHPARPASNGGAAPDLERIFAYIKARAASDPGILQLLTSAPELRVKRERRLLEMNDTGTPGRIGLLIADKFFDQPKNSGDVTKEFKRRGWFSVKTSNAAVLRPLADIAEMGFLTRDGSSYQSVPGMKVNIVEA